jgi:peptidoglycan/LPS O-acetylase OafA/YrhL
MRIFTFFSSLLLIAIGGMGCYGWGMGGEGPQTLVSAIPGGFGAMMLFGGIVAMLLRRTGLQISFLAAIAGAFSGLGRLTPAYLSDSLDWKSQPTNLIVAMSAICLLYLLASAVAPVLPKRSRKEPGEVGSTDDTPESIPC